MKENKKAKKVVALLLCAVLLVVGSVTGTMAYLTSQATVTNTFTVGNVAITLDEALVNANGVAIGGRTTVGQTQTYKLMPGHNYEKDPTIHVTAGSEECYLFVKVVNEISVIEDATTIADQMSAKGWTPVDGVSNVYAYNQTVSGGENIVVFEEFTIKDNVVNDTLADYANKTIVVTAYAVQADGFTGNTPADIWTAAGFN